MIKVRIDLPESVLSGGQTPEELVQEAKLLLALKFFELGRISSGRAAGLCDMPRLDFLLLAGRSRLPVAVLEGDELDEEFG